MQDVNAEEKKIKRGAADEGSGYQASHQTTSLSSEGILLLSKLGLSRRRRRLRREHIVLASNMMRGRDDNRLIRVHPAHTHIIYAVDSIMRVDVNPRAHVRSTIVIVGIKTVEVHVREAVVQDLRGVEVEHRRDRRGRDGRRGRGARG